MGTFSFQNRIRHFICLALTLMHNDALQEFFPQSRHLTWDGARNHCRVCFKELVTLTPDNIGIITPTLLSDSWIGLRKNFPGNSSESPGRPWSRWADGEPLTFQNWYPGRPVPPSPPTACCGFPCSACPPAAAAANSSDSTRSWALANSTDLNGTGSARLSGPPTTTTAQCVKIPMPVPNHSEAEDGYTEDPCVAMLSFGAWVEKECSERLPFICQDDRFTGRASVSEVTPGAAALAWLRGPGGVGHYRVEVGGDRTKTHNRSGLTSNLEGLTAGTRYSVRVFPVKCGRDLPPQEVTFYTRPHKVGNLTVAMVTTTSVLLSWSRPAGHLDFYVVKVHGEESRSYAERSEVTGLTPATRYTVTVRSALNATATWSEESSVSVQTKPGIVSNLSVPDNSNVSLQLSWSAPEDNTTAFRVRATATTAGHHEFFHKIVQRDWTQSRQAVRVTGQPPGTRIAFAVAALAGDTAGEEATAVGYTAPPPVSDLRLEAGNRSVRATWSSAARNLTFTVSLRRGRHDLETEGGLTRPEKSFERLQTGAEYTLVVYCMSGDLPSQPAEASIVIPPSPLADAKVVTSTKTSLTFQWTSAIHSASSSVRVELSSAFWGHTQAFTLASGHQHTFRNLRSGTRYQFLVESVVGYLRSPPLLLWHSTVAEEREISLSMVCSSTALLRCAAEEDGVLAQLRHDFKQVLGDHVFWKLEKQESEQTRV